MEGVVGCWQRVGDGLRQFGAACGHRLEYEWVGIGPGLPRVGGVRVGVGISEGRRQGRGVCLVVACRIVSAIASDCPVRGAWKICLCARRGLTARRRRMRQRVGDGLRRGRTAAELKLAKLCQCL